MLTSPNLKNGLGDMRCNGKQGFNRSCRVQGVWWAGTLSRKPAPLLSLGHRFPPLVPHGWETESQSSWSLVLVDGAMSNACRLLSGEFILTVFPIPLILCTSQSKAREICPQTVLMRKENLERTKDWQQAATFRNLIHKLGTHTHTHTSFYLNNFF